jgi:uncharacterized damage-inducible protein DinB
MALKDALLAEYDHELATTKKLLERVPEDRLAWKPHGKSMSIGGLSQHIANIPNWGTTILNEAGFDLSTAPPNLEEPSSHADIMKWFEDARAKARQALDKTDGELLAMWSLTRGGQPMFSMPRISAFRSFVLNHIIHHRGQLSVYLRLNDIPVPSIYGPSADEG